MEGLVLHLSHAKSSQKVIFPPEMLYYNIKLPKNLKYDLRFLKTTLKPKEQIFLKWQVINSP